MKKQIMSIAAAAALFTTGAMAFDYTYDGEIVVDITNATLDPANNGVTGIFASYVGGEEAGNENLTLSTNAKGDALIYPAFKAGESWSSNIVVRNSENNATVCKVVLYAADNSRELLDFDIYLSPYDVFRFDIAEDGTVSTNDGSFALIDPTLNTNSHQFVEHNGATQVIGKINARAENADVISGYAVIYAMVESTNKKVKDDNSTLVTALDVDGKGAYHGEHGKLLEDFRTLTDICRDTDNDIATKASWRTVLGSNSANVKNGTATSVDVVAPNVSIDCLTVARDRADNNATLDKIIAMSSTFTSPSSDLLFGDVTISKGGADPRNLLIPATALDNYTAANQMMMWVPGEYAAIQDRRIGSDMNTSTTITGAGYAVGGHDGYSDYNLTGIAADSLTFETVEAYYTFDKNEMKGANTLLVTQPTKRAITMAGQASRYWVTATTGISPIENKWGEFTTQSSYYDENELLDVASTSLAVVISPISGDPDAAYKNELQAINDPERTETASSVFAVSGDNGFAIMGLGGDNGLPAIVTQMTGSVVNGESQINWVYSTTNK